jgi:lipoyl(octanoyl) transferase
MVKSTQGELHWFEQQDYTLMREMQHQSVQQVIANPLKPMVFLGSHRHVITLGRGSHADNLLESSQQGLEPVERHKIERGGDVTYHGPGQLVGYPIIHLDSLGGRRDLHRYLRNLEEVLILTLKSYGIGAGRQSGLTGVWVGDNLERKIASIGIAVKKWVTYHGFAINLNTDLRYFSMLNPCGLNSAVMTSLAKELGRPVDMIEFAIRLLNAMHEVFAINFSAPHIKTASKPDQHTAI